MTYPNANFNPSHYFISFAWYQQQWLKNFKVKLQNHANLREVWLCQYRWISRKFPKGGDSVGQEAVELICQSERKTQKMQ